jgi:nitroreductase
MKTRFFLVALAAAALFTSCCGQSQECCQQGSENNGTIETIMARRSIRKYKSTPVSRDTLNMILECGINAPNGQNRQSWEVRVVDNPATMEQIKEIMAQANPDMNPAGVKGCFRDAPVMLFIARDPSYQFSAYDVGLLSENVMLSAWSLGVGSVCLGSPIRYLAKSPEAIQMLGFSEGYVPIICIGLGYPNESPDAKPRDKAKIKYLD